jgi:hypothetical protein
MHVEIAWFYYRLAWRVMRIRFVSFRFFPARSHKNSCDPASADMHPLSHTSGDPRLWGQPAPPPRPTPPPVRLSYAILTLSGFLFSQLQPCLAFRCIYHHFRMAFTGWEHGGYDTLSGVTGGFFLFQLLHGVSPSQNVVLTKYYDIPSEFSQLDGTSSRSSRSVHV